MDYESNIRMECLRLAQAGRHSDTSSVEIIEDAKAFYGFLMNAQSGLADGSAVAGGRGGGGAYICPHCGSARKTIVINTAGCGGTGWQMPGGAG